MEIVIKNRQRLIKINLHRIKKAIEKSIRYLQDSRPQLFPNLLTPEGICKDCTIEVSVLFVNDNKMRELNLGYRAIDKTTDVLSFPQDYPSDLNCKEENGLLLGDIVINLHKAKRQAEAHQVGFYHEVMWLLVHGLLHLLGFDHEKNRYQAKKMRELETELLEVICR